MDYASGSAWAHRLSIWAACSSRRFPLAAFGIAWFLIGHSLESTFIPLELVHEHRNYLPLFGMLLLPVGCWMPWWRSRGCGEQWRRTLVGVLLAYLGFVTAMRADMFANESMRTQLEAQFHPDSARTNYEAGRTLAVVADHDQAT